MTPVFNDSAKLGFGLMRLPEKDEVIDHEQLCKMVDAYMASGFNYFDTAYIYHGGKSETAAREALVKRYPRESFTLADKLPAWCIKEEADIEKILNDQLDRLGTDYIDYYLLHSVEDGNNYDTYEKYDCFSWGLQKKAEGKIKHFGFSYHGSPELLVKVLDAHPEVEFVQIQLNYADWNNPVVRSGELYNILNDRNIPIIVMEPVKGGTLANLTPNLEEKFKAVRPDDSAASWALRYVASLPGVKSILSGMSNEEQMNDNIKTFVGFEPLTAEEETVVNEVRDLMLSTNLIACTSCRYCTDGCPMGISIPDVFRAVNTLRLYPEDVFRPKMFYQGLSERTAKASECVECGQCEGVCPQHLSIVDYLKEAAAAFEN